MAETPITDKVEESNDKDDGIVTGKEGVAVAPSLPGPPQEYIVALKGYEKTGAIERVAVAVQNKKPPPIGDSSSADVDIPKPQYSKEEAREALLQYAKKKLCYGNCAAKGMVIGDVTHSPAFNYELVTFAENRSTIYEQMPYREGDAVDGPDNGAPPLPWDISVPPPTLFVDSMQQVEVPHSSYVRPCHVCVASGCISCFTCGGIGIVPCLPCGGSGKKSRYRGKTYVVYTCRFCLGTGQGSCSSCYGSGRIACPKCFGTTRLKWYIMLTAEFKNYSKKFIYESTDMPDHLVLDAKGDEIFKQELPRLQPISTFPQQEINDNSATIVKEHENYFNSSRVIMQRQTITCVSVTQLDVKYNDEPFTFYVYGKGHQVYTDEYPHTCCCCKGCAIL